MPAPQPSQIERLAFIRYLAAVGQGQLQLPEPTAASALLTFHDAIELFLQLAAEHLHVQMRYPKDHFVDYWPKLADAGVAIPFSEAMKRLNDARVSLKHRGVLPRRSDLTDFGVIVLDFLRQATPLVFGLDVETVSLTVLLEDAEARAELQNAETALREERILDSLSAAATAFDMLLRNYERSATEGTRGFQSPFQPAGLNHSSFGHFRTQRGSRMPYGQVSEVDALTSALEREFKSVWKVIEGLEDALRIVLLGLDFRRHVRFKRLTPRVHHVMAQPSRRLSEIDTGTPQDAQFCIEFVIESALRLQAFDLSGSMLG
jgi:hypothetical protein